jgi:signal transduction histidine kinase
LVFIFFSVFITQSKYQRNRLAKFVESVQVEREYIFDRILSLQEQSLQTFAYDYSFRDDMVNFVTTPEKKWATENIDAALNTYQASAAWVYNLDCQLVYSINNLDKESGFKEIPVPRQVISSLFSYSPFCHFFANTPQGLMEFYGAAIQSSADARRESAAKMGYLFCSRLWSKSYLDEFARLTSSNLLLADTAENKFVGLKYSVINFFRALPGWNNYPVKYLKVFAKSGAIVNARKSVLQVTMLFFIFLVVILVLFSIFIFYWVSIPLKLITLSLKKENPAFLKKLKKQNTEFGDVSRLVDSFFMQRKEVIREISERKWVQDMLIKINHCLAFFEPDPDRKIQLITETAGQILKATYMLYNSYQDTMLVTRGSWNEPVDFNRLGLCQGHLCFEISKTQTDQPLVIKDLKHTSYVHTDPNINKYNLQCYIGCPVRVQNKTVGMLCAFFDYEAQIDENYLNLLQVLAKAASIEEERGQMDKVLAVQALKLDNSLKEALKSREILLSMLEDNQLNKLKLEESVQELAVAYSKLKESQEEVIQTAKFGAVGQLASSVAHEVRNPLAIIMQSVEYLETKVPLQYREVVQISKNNIKRANTIIGTLLDFSRAKKISMGQEDLNSILNDSLALTQYGNIQDKIRVIKELGNDLPKVLADRQKLEQVFVNVILNAMQSMTGKGNLLVRTYLVEFNNLQEEAKAKLAFQALSIKNVVVTEIKDEGMGISEENMKNIFRPFFTTKGAMMGMGLGLTVVKDIIEMHNGYLEIASQVGEGTMVRIFLRAEEGGV